MKLHSFIGLILISFLSSSLAEQVAPGLVYDHLVQSDPAQSIHIMIADPSLIQIGIGIANGTCASAQTTSQIAHEQNALAAINAGFFDFGCKFKAQDLIIKLLDCIGYNKYTAYPIWTLHTDNHYYSLSPIYTGAIAWNNADQRPIFSAIKTNIELQIHNAAFPVHAFNKPNAQGPALYSSVFDAKTPYTYTSRVEIAVQSNQIIQIYPSCHGRTPIPHNGYVYSLPGTYRKLANQCKVGDVVQVTFSNTQKPEFSLGVENSAWDRMDNILASTPLLLQHRIIPDHVQNGTSEFTLDRHPRSAVGVLENGNWVFMVADGRQKHAEGFTILELAQYMQKLGCTDALALDGGGSSTLVIKNTIMNKPSGRGYGTSKKERPVSNAIVLKASCRECLYASTYAIQ